ncbi:MAG: hypothetical protein EXR79_08650 [Myxococcales bacterium]|nr:hypothetical protein [Myxococcales bacterium]
MSAEAANPGVPITDDATPAGPMTDAATPAGPLAAAAGADADGEDDGEQSSIRLDITIDEKLATADAVCRRLFELLGYTAPGVQVRLEEDQIVVHLDGVDAAATQSGDTRVLESVQFVLNKAVNRWAAKRTRLSLDAEGFRRRRPEGLDRVAHRLAEKALLLGKSIAVGPMGQGDLRFLSAQLQRIPSVIVQPFSGPDRRRLLIQPAVAPEPGIEPADIDAAGQPGGFRRNRRRRRH